MLETFLIWLAVGGLLGVAIDASKGRRSRSKTLLPHWWPLAAFFVIFVALGG